MDKKRKRRKKAKGHLLTTSRALGLAIGQNLFINELRDAVLKYTDAVTPEQVIAVGATGLPMLASSPEVLDALRRAYSDSVAKTFILALAGACAAVLPSLWMEHLNIKRIAEARARAKEALAGQEEGGERFCSDPEGRLVSVEMVGAKGGET